MTSAEILGLKSKVIPGKYVNLRVATEEDAEFILEIRLNPLLNKFVGKTDPSVENQKAWISNSRRNEKDFHFIIEDKKGNRYGTVALYNIDYDKRGAEWGRWVIKSNAPVFVSIESMILVLFFAFRKLNLQRLHGGASNENRPVVKFHKMYAGVSATDDTHTWFYFEEEHFIKALSLFKYFHNLA